MSQSSSPPRPGSAPGAHPPAGKGERLARVFDEEIHPLYTRRFEQLLLRALVPTPGARVLELGCHAGALTDELVRTFDHESQIIAVDDDPALLALAKERIGRDHPGRRVFFRHNPSGDKLPFADEHFNTVIANIQLDNLPDPEAVLADLVRVTRPGGRFLVTSAIRGSWAEVVDVLREVLVRRWDVQALAALDQYEARLFDGETLARTLERLGVRDVRVDVDRWELLFRTAREFLFAPVIEIGPLKRWKAVAGRGEIMQNIFNDMRTSIDTYYAGRSFGVSVVAGCLSGNRDTEPMPRDRRPTPPIPVDPDNLG